jgi:RNA polymerase sigma-70 factor (ECF subfamily)
VAGEPTEEQTIRDADLARRCRQGDAAAWRMLIRRCAPLVYRVALQVLRNPADAEDASQEVFLRIHRSFDTFDATRPLAPWVSRITYNTCLQRLRSAASRHVATAPEAFERDPDSRQVGPETLAARQEAGALLQEALDCLSAQDRALLDLRYREGLSDAELAEATGMPVNTVKTRLFRARKALRRRLGPKLRDPDTPE